MKLSAYHKAKGHTVEWWNAKGRYDLVYKSRVFTDTYSKDTITVTNAEQVIFGGTGYDTKNRLPPEVEHSYPDYSIYPQFFGIAYGFLSRGCPRNCGFCKSIDAGQREGALAMGMSPMQAMFYVILPQAFKNIIPEMANTFLTNLKMTSVLNVIGIQELFMQAKTVGGTYYKYFESYLVIALIYLVLCVAFNRLFLFIEKKMAGKKDYVLAVEYMEDKQ